jgi:HEAT repeat protein
MSILKFLIRWGVLFVIAYGIYFLIHLTALRKTDDPSWINFFTPVGRLLPDKQYTQKDADRLAQQFKVYEPQVSVPENAPEDLKKKMMELEKPHADREKILAETAMLVRRREFDSNVAQFYIDRLRVKTATFPAQMGIGMVQAKFPTFQNHYHSVYPNLDEVIISLKENAVDELIKTLDDPDSFMRAYAAVLLSSIKDNRAKPFIEKAIKKEGEKGALALMQQALKNIPDESLAEQRKKEIEEIEQAFSEVLTKEEVRQYILRLVELNALDFIYRGLENQEGHNWLLILINLKVIPKDLAHPSELAPKLHSTLFGLRELAVQTLETWEATEYADEIADLLDDPNVNVIKAAISALGKFRAAEYAPQVAEYLNSSYPMNMDALRALTKMNVLDEYTFELASILSADKNPYEICSVMQALRGSNVRDFISDIDNFLLDERSCSAPGEKFINALGEETYTNELSTVAAETLTLMKSWSEPDFDLRTYKADPADLQTYDPIKLVLTLQKLDAQQKSDHKDEIIKLLTNKNPAVRLAAVQALSDFKDDSIGAALKEVAYDFNDKVRLKAIAVLKNFPGIDISDALQKTLQDSDANARLTAAESLSQVSAPEILSPPDKLVIDDPTLFPACKYPDCGYINKLGQIVIGLSFYEAQLFQEDVAWVATRKIVNNNYEIRYGLINRNGKFLLEPKYDKANPFSNGIALVQKGKQWFYITKEDKIICNLGDKFENADNFDGGIGRVKLANQTFFIYPDGKREAVNLEGDMFPYHEGLARYRLTQPINPKTGIRPGDGVVSFEGVTIELSGLKKNAPSGQPYNLWGYYDKDKKPVIKMQFQMAQDFHEGLAAVMPQNANQFGYIDSKGEMIIPPQFDQAYDFKDGWARVQKGPRWFFIDKKGKVALELPHLEYVGEFSEDVAVAMIELREQKEPYRSLGRIYGYIDKKGDFTINPTFGWTGDFHEGLAMVGDDRGRKIINKKGQYVWKKE